MTIPQYLMVKLSLDLMLQPLQQSRLESRLFMLYKIVRGMVPAINAEEVFVFVKTSSE